MRAAFLRVAAVLVMAAALAGRTLHAERVGGSVLVRAEADLDADLRAVEPDAKALVAGLDRGRWRGRRSAYQ